MDFSDRSISSLKNSACTQGKDEILICPPPYFFFFSNIGARFPLTSAPGPRHHRLELQLTGTLTSDPALNEPNNMHYIYDSRTHMRSPTPSVCRNDSSCALYKWGGGEEEKKKKVIAVHSREKSVNSALCRHKPASVQPEYKTAWAHFSTEESRKQPSHGCYLFKKVQLNQIL